MRVLLVAVLLSASLCAALPPRFRSTAPGDDCIRGKGSCVEGDCVGGQQIRGQCGGKAVCCIKNENVKNCLALGGKCDDKDKNPCAGTWKSGQCPGKYVCCVPGAGQQQAAPQQQAQAAAAPAPQQQAQAAAAPSAPSVPKLLCMTFDDGPFDPVSFDLATAMAKEKVPSTFYVNCHKKMDAGRRAQWVKLLKDYGHNLGNHMCEHDIMANAHYKASYDSTPKVETGCMKRADSRATFRTHVHDNYVLWRDAGFPFKTARLNGDGRFNPCVVKYVEHPDIDHADNPGSKEAFAALVPQKHVAWNFEIGPTMTPNEATPKPVMGHITFKTDITHNGHTMFQTEALPSSTKTSIVLAHDLHYGAGEKVKLLVKWVQWIKSKGYTWGKISDKGQCVPAPDYNPTVV